MAGQADPRGVRALTAEVISKESTPIFNQLIDGEWGTRLIEARVALLAADFGKPPRFHLDDRKYQVDLPALTMSEAVNLVTDRLHALTTPTDLYPVVELQELIGGGLGR